MQFLLFLIIFILVIIISSFFIVGFYNISRYYIEVQPDGKEVVKGYLLKYWSYWFEYVKRYDKKYYSGEALQHKLSELKKMLPVIGNKIMLPASNETSFISEEGAIGHDEKDKIEILLSCKLEGKKHGNQVFSFLYIEEPVYLFPSIIRKPFSQCVVCMSSVFGSAIWLIINYLYNPFSWTNHNIFAFISFWFIFIVVLSRMNGLIYRKTEY